MDPLPNGRESAQERRLDRMESRHDALMEHIRAIVEATARIETKLCDLEIGRANLNRWALTITGIGGAVLAASIGLVGRLAGWLP